MSFEYDQSNNFFWKDRDRNITHFPISFAMDFVIPITPAFEAA